MPLQGVQTLAAPGKGAKHPVPDHAGAIEVGPNPADDLPAEVAQRVLSAFLGVDDVSGGLVRV